MRQETSWTDGRETFTDTDNWRSVVALYLLLLLLAHNVITLGYSGSVWLSTAIQIQKTEFSKGTTVFESSCSYYY
jgi:hypothetical protein